jgi:transposase
VSENERKTGEDRQPNVRQMRVIVALIEHPTIADAAAACDIGESTIRRWLAEDETFREALRDATQRLLEHTLAHAPMAADKGVKVLEEIAASETAPANARVAAAKYLDARRLRLIEVGDLQHRVDELEELYRALNTRRGI